MDCRVDVAVCYTVTAIKAHHLGRACTASNAGMVNFSAGHGFRGLEKTAASEVAPGVAMSITVSRLIFRDY